MASRGTGGVVGRAGDAGHDVPQPFTAYGTSLGITRIIPVHNVTEDLAWTKGAHDIRFGGVIRLINNRSTNFANSFSSATTNSSWLQGVGSDITPPSLGVQSGFLTSYRDGMMALLGIVSQGNARYNYRD